MIKFILLIYFLHSCSSFNSIKQMSENEKKIGHHKLYSYPKKTDLEQEKKRLLSLNKSNKKNILYQTNRPSKKNTNNSTIIITALSSNAANFEPRNYSLYDKRFDQKTHINVGGSILTSKYIDQLKKITDGNLIFLNAGGDWPSNHLDLPAFIFHRKIFQFHAQSMAPKDFQAFFSHPRLLRETLDQQNTPTVISNIRFISNDNLLIGSPIKKTQILKVNNLKIGIIGITSPQIISRNHQSYFQGILFEDPAQTIFSLAPELRREGANLIIVLFYGGINCTSLLSQKLNFAPEKVNFYPSEEVCDLYNNEIADTLKKIPPQYIDLVITGGKNTKVVNFIKSTPVMSAFDNGEFLSMIEFTYSHQLNAILPEKTLMLQPVKLCQQHFKESRDCFLEEPPRLFEIEDAQFLDYTIRSEKNK